MTPRNIEDGGWDEQSHGTAEFRRKKLSTPTDTTDIGCSVYELPPGKHSWPYHYHTANEEALFVLNGTGQLRGPEDTIAIQAGDYVGFPANESGGHQLINTSDDVLRYLIMSTMAEPDVTIYPGSEKFGVFVGAPPGSDMERSLHGYYPIDGDVEYWDGE